jgi:hypothetical protein
MIEGKHIDKIFGSLESALKYKNLDQNCDIHDHYDIENVEEF